MSVDAYTPNSGDARIRVDSYDLALDYNVATNRLDATATIRGRATAAIRDVSFDLVGLRVGRVRVAGDKNATFRQTDRKLRIALSAMLAPDDPFAVTVSYAGSPRPRRTRWGAIGWEELDDGAFVAAQPTGAPTWFPCNDVPSDKAAYRVAITVPASYTVAASGRLTDRRTRSGKTTWVYESVAPTATYLATVQIGRYRINERRFSDVAGEVLHPAALTTAVSRDLSDLPGMMRRFESAFGPYPFDRYTVVVTADDLEIPLEAQGMGIFGANHLDGTGRLERLVAHELAHQWFGNSVGLRHWRDIWLNEGFACYAEWIWSEAAGGPTASDHAASHHARLAALAQDLVIGDPGPDLMFDDRVYKRGALTLHALRLTVGDAAFFDVLRGWTASFAGSAATTADFVALAETTTGRSLGALFAAWLDERALPPLPVSAPARPSRRTPPRR